LKDWITLNRLASAKNPNKEIPHIMIYEAKKVAEESYLIIEKGQNQFFE